MKRNVIDGLSLKHASLRRSETTLYKNRKLKCVELKWNEETTRIRWNIRSNSNDSGEEKKIQFILTVIHHRIVFHIFISDRYESNERFRHVHTRLTFFIFSVSCHFRLIRLMRRHSTWPRTFSRSCDSVYFLFLSNIHSFIWSQQYSNKRRPRW